MRLLVIGEKKSELDQACRIASKAGALVVLAESSARGLKALREEGADLVMIDVNCNVPAFIAATRAEHIAVEVVACGTKNDPAAAAGAIAAGAREYVPLPPDATLIAEIIRQASETRIKLVFRDKVMARSVAYAETAANSDVSLLITGASGTGKEVMARHIHALSKRADRPFVPVNCAAIPEALLESELFGHEKGAFTGAVARRIGKFEEACGGTLLLDEISEMDVRLQAKLLRAIQEKQITRVGGTGQVPVNIRIIATSNRDLKEAVARGTFREDLLYRLNVIEVQLPPLNSRPDDVEALAEHFVAEICAANGTAEAIITDGARALLRSYEWPGNVRELENMMHRAVLLAQSGEITEASIVTSNGVRLDEIDMHLRAKGGPDLGDDIIAIPVGADLATIEREAIRKTMRRVDNHQGKTAKILGISVRTIYSRLAQYERESAGAMKVAAK